MASFLLDKEGDRIVFHDFGILTGGYIMAKKEVGFNLNNEDYKTWITNIKKKIKQSQIKAAVKVNYELLGL